MLTSTVIAKEMLVLSKTLFLKMSGGSFGAKLVLLSQEVLGRRPGLNWQRKPERKCNIFSLLTLFRLMKLFVIDVTDLNPRICCLSFLVFPFHLKCLKCFLVCFVSPCLE